MYIAHVFNMMLLNSKIFTFFWSRFGIYALEFKICHKITKYFNFDANPTPILFSWDRCYSVFLYTWLDLKCPRYEDHLKFTNYIKCKLN